MSGTIASLGLSVNSSEAAQAATDLDKLTAAGSRAEKAVKTVADSADKLDRSAKKASTSLKEQAKEADDAADSFKKLYGGTSAVEAGFFSLDNRIKNGSFVKGLAASQEADKWLASLSSTTKEVGASFLDTSSKLTYLSSGLKGLGAWAGAGSPVFGQVAKQSIDAAAGIGGFGRAAVQTEISAKAMQAALRGVPAQFTDIAVSLQGGQSPLTVLLQQGGQLKDMFGGVGPAAKALGGYVLGLVNPFTLAAAAIGAVSLAYYKGSEEADEYNKGLILTGNYAGTSASQLADMARQVSATVGTTGAAAAVLAQLAGSGKIASGSFQEITEAALEMEKATGKAVEETVAEFVKIADDPVAAAKSLNDQYHFLTASVYSQIVALKEQGDTVGAVKLLTDTYANTVSTRAGEITKNLGLIERGWNAIKGAAAGALDATLNVGREQTLEQQIAALQKRINTPSSYSAIPIIGEDNPDLTKTGSTQEQDQSHLNFLLLQRDAEASKNKYVADRARVEQDAILATDRADARHLATLSNAEKRALEIKKINEDTEKIRAANPNDKRVSAEYVAQQIKDVNDKYKDAKGPANQLDLTSFNDAQNQLKALTAAYSNSQKELDAQQKAGIVSQESYAAQRAALIQAEKEEVTSAYQAEISALEATRDKSSTSAQQRIQLDQKIADARTSMVKAQKDADSQLEVLATNEQGRLRKQELAVKTYTDALQQQVATLREQGQRAAATIGMGDRQQGLYGQQNAIDDRINQQKVELANQYGDGSRGMSIEEYQQKLAALNATQKDLRDTVQSNYDDMTAAQGSWSAGASSAFQNYLDSARDVAGQTKSLFTNAFSSMEDAIVNFALTGKLSFSDFAKSIISDLVRIEARQAASSGLSALFGLATKAATSYFGGPSSAGSTQAGYSSTYFPQAKGGAWADGVQMFANGAAFTNSIVSSPTAFGMAGGQTGVMGEAGPEAIMPLTRTAGGALGVRALGANGGGDSNNQVVVQQTFQIADGDSVGSDQQTMTVAKAYAAAAKQGATEQIAKELKPNGLIWRAINGR